MHFLSIFLVLGILKISYPEVLNHENEENRETFPLAINAVEQHEADHPDVVVGVSVVNSVLSPKTLSELHDLAKNISHAKGIYKETDKEMKSDDEKEIRRSILKKATVATESDAMKAILYTFESEKNKLELLDQMEYLVHQYDVAVNFASLGGIEIITPLLFSTDDKIISSVASVLGAAMQSNPTVQQSALKLGVDKNLMNLLTHKSPNVLSRIIFALSSLLRNFPEAQVEFLATNGISQLVEILKDHHIATNTKLKIINLFNDLTVEQETSELIQNDRAEKINKLRRLFASEMQKCDICKLIPSFLDLEDFDTHQKIASAMISLYSACHSDFKNDAIDFRLKRLLQIYDPDSDDQNPVYPIIDKDLKKDLHSELKELIKKINEENGKKFTQFMLKEEL